MNCENKKKNATYLKWIPGRKGRRIQMGKQMPWGSQGLFLVHIVQPIKLRRANTLGWL